MDSKSRILVAVTLALGLSSAAWAECIGLVDGVRRQKQAAAFVFDGTPTRVDHVAADGTRARMTANIDLQPLAQREDAYLRVYAATFEVHRIWKGKISTEITVYSCPMLMDRSSMIGEGGWFSRALSPRSSKNNTIPAIVPLQECHGRHPVQALRQTILRR